MRSFCERTFNHSSYILSNVRRELPQQIEHRVVPGVLDGEVDSAIEERPYNLHLAAERGLVHRRAGRCSGVDVHPRREQHFHASSGNIKVP